MHLRAALRWGGIGGMPNSLNRLYVAIFAAVFSLACAAQTKTPPPMPPGALSVYFVDVEGGQSTLFVTPDKHSLLVDTGWNDHGGRDADRIEQAMALAGIHRLDAVLLTHYHVDHTGGVPNLVARVPVGMFLDHGPNREPDDASTENAPDEYFKLLATGKYQRHIMHPGEKLPVPGFDATAVSADGKVITQSLPGGGEPNAFCSDAGQKTPDATENSRSLGFVLQWGSARVLDLGDLTRDKEKELMCPTNRLGHIDLLVVSHHGWYQSSSRALVDAITPRVAVMDNGATKGGSIPVLDTFRNDPSHPALWQLHYSDEGGAQHNTAAAQIANLKGTAQGPDAGYLLRVTVARDGSLAVWNSRTGKVIVYSAPVENRLPRRENKE